MSSIDFLKGLGFGMVAGTAIGMAMTPKHGHKKSMASRALHNMGEIVENITDVMGM